MGVLQLVNSKSSSAAVKHKRRPAPSTKTCAWTSPAHSFLAARAAPALHRVGVEWTLPETRTGAAVVPCIDWLGALVALLRYFRECLFAPLCARSVDSIGAPSACCARSVRRCEHPRAHPLLASAPSPRLVSPDSHTHGRYLHRCRYR